MVSSSSMYRRLCRCRDGIVALVAMASLPLLMRRRLAVVDDNGDGAADDDNDEVDGDGVVGHVETQSPGTNVPSSSRTYEHTHRNVTWKDPKDRILPRRHPTSSPSPHTAK